jgi:hypothetical protein
MVDKIMLSRREYRAVMLAIASHLADAQRLQQLRPAAIDAGLSESDVAAILAGGVPRDLELANVVAGTGATR